MYHRNPFFNLCIWLITGFGYFGSRFKHSQNLLTATQNDIINQVAEKEKLKLQLDQLKIELQNKTQEQMLALNRERATWQLERESENARVKMERDAEKSKFDLEKEQSVSRQKLDTEQAIKRAELKNEELLVMKKLDFEQKIKQAELDREKAILLIKEEYAKKETKLHTELHAEMYGKLNSALISMSQEGDKNTKFVHDIMMKIFDKAPALNSHETRTYIGAPLPKPVEAEVRMV